MHASDAEKKDTSHEYVEVGSQGIKDTINKDSKLQEINHDFRTINRNQTIKTLRPVSLA
jgi:hypothetical protein